MQPVHLRAHKAASVLLLVLMAVWQALGMQTRPVQAFLHFTSATVWHRPPRTAGA